MIRRFSVAFGTSSGKGKRGRFADCLIRMSMLESTLATRNQFCLGDERELDDDGRGRASLTALFSITVRVSCSESITYENH